jgi:hypothetical protein
MQVKLVYDDANGGTEFLRCLQLDEVPTKGQVLDVGGGVMLEVIEVTPAPDGGSQKASALVRPLRAAA